MRKPVILATLTLISSLAVGCSSIDKIDTSTPEGAYQLAEEYEKDERYDEAVQRFQEVRTKFPYSKLATAAELKIADVHYKREAFIEAQGAYQLFKDFHPKHAQIDYVTFRLAMSYFNQLPDTIDRDLSVADKAILYFDEVMTSYPTSAHAGEARDRKAAALKMLAEKELYVADFYMKRRTFESALKRYEYLLKTYPSSGLDARALYGAAKSAFELGEKDRALQHYRQLSSLYPSSSEAKQAKDDFEKYGAN
ncbi:MAG: outer membrane protein assembly factor BamD [Bdellovibrionaceae bacterium]|nr:outer membrane protein assembly factor BamD [Pseudobdellovibrionaceae bacterium]